MKIVVFEDCSTDGTRKIVQEYEAEYAKLFKVFYMSENTFGKTIRKEATKPFRKERAKGKYIALCEGDDYWTDPLKLQKQVDFLEKNEDYGLVYTDLDILYQESGIVKPSIFKNGLSYINNEHPILSKGYLLILPGYIEVSC